MNDMEKPLSLIILEAKEKMSETVNSLKLTPTLLEPIVKELYEQIIELRQQEIQRDKLKYQQYLEKNKLTEDRED